IAGQTAELGKSGNCGIAKRILAGLRRGMPRLYVRVLAASNVLPAAPTSCSYAVFERGSARVRPPQTVICAAGGRCGRAGRAVAGTVGDLVQLLQRDDFDARALVFVV